MTTNNILLLPVDILVFIFKKLKLTDLRNVMLTCKTIRNLVQNDNTIWRSISRERLILQDFIDNRYAYPINSFYNILFSL